MKQESLFYWQPLFTNSDKVKEVWRVSQMPQGKYPEPRFSAFTVAKLGEMLHNAHLMIHTISSNVGGEPHKWVVAYVKKIEHIEAISKQHKAGISSISHLEHVEIEETEADSRAKMLIYLLENKLITV